MLQFVIAVVLMLVALAAIVLRKTYYYLPEPELKRQARTGDKLAATLYKVVSYGTSLRLLLWLLIGIAAAIGLVLFVRIAPVVIGFVVVAVVLWLGFAWMPSTRLTSYGARLAFWLTPVVYWLLNQLNPLFSRLTEVFHRYFPPQIHSGLYEKDDLISLIEQQRLQPDNRIPEGEIEMALHALTFGDKLVADVLVPKRVVTMVKADETIGPSLMDELHKSGHSRFPVYEGKDDNIVGILYLHDLVATRKTGTVKDLMKPHATYVHEDFTLYQTLQAFLKTKRHLFVTVNSFEEFTGIITIEDIIEQIVGRAIVDEFDKYGDLRAVAAAAAKKDHIAHEKKNSEPEPTETTEEVVE